MEYNALHLIYETHFIASVKQTFQVRQRRKFITATLLKTFIIFPVALFSQLRHFGNLAVVALTKINMQCGRCSLWPAAHVKRTVNFNFKTSGLVLIKRHSSGV